MENIVCPICEIDKTKFFYDRERNDNPVNYVICELCGLVFQSPRMTVLEFEEYYKKGFREENSRSVGEMKSYIASRAEVGKQIGKFISRYLNSTIVERIGLSRGSILDIGCGSGATLLYFRDRGHRCRGVDIKSSMTEYGRRELGLDIVETPFEKYVTPDMFKLVILNHVFEHILNPVEFLTQIRSLLRDDGCVYVEVPDVERPYSWTELKFFFLLGHVFYYSISTLENIFNKCGFELVTHESQSTPFLRAVFRKKEEFQHHVKFGHAQDILAKYAMLDSGVKSIG